MPEIAIDAHVHLHDPANAITHVKAACAQLYDTLGHISTAVLMLAEQAGHNVFGVLRDSLEPSAEPEALWLGNRADPALIVAGRQIVSAEGLEILALACMDSVEDGLPARALVSRLLAQDAIVVLPWGVGKWLGKRGQLVRDLIATYPKGTLFLGDNGGRPSFWPMSDVPQARVLSGSDPLPLPGSARRLGTFGTMLSTRLSRDHPLRDLKAALRNPAQPLVPFGRAASLARFSRDQIRLRLK
ncbi:hypothetical protein C1T17_12720 [Sphingobium sp. SCG-1]|uniref:hypothetical protein n=1 Tax=Sphingobium sp. SCG-1 TaxID=2072936 RepID=UPI000CD6A74C|nr:hypothetical protein [Sphingobium sp. SCG-1]AUW58825.1 hypothetical protein C1T17_12720 [Sphingobium sp. SCG-1]